MVEGRGLLQKSGKSWGQGVISREVEDDACGGSRAVKQTIGKAVDMNIK